MVCRYPAARYGAIQVVRDSSSKFRGPVPLNRTRLAIKGQCRDAALDVNHHFVGFRRVDAAIAAYEFSLRHELRQIFRRWHEIFLAYSRTQLLLQLSC